MVYGNRRIRRGWHGQFRGFRINCEQVPVLPAWTIREFWDDPRNVPYLLVWRSRRNYVIKEAVRVTRRPQRPHENESIEVKRTDGTCVPVYLTWRVQPRGGRTLFLRCWQCQRPCRALFGCMVGDDGRYYCAVRADWMCRRCAGLTYSSEGGALMIRGGVISRLLRHPFPDVPSPRPDPWTPLVFSSPGQAKAAGVLPS
jgi:hypothetical protein